jgi:hypothetical protein
VKSCEKRELALVLVGQELVVQGLVWLEIGV